jgi:hypothetical protein
MDSMKTNDTTTQPARQLHSAALTDMDDMAPIDLPEPAPFACPTCDARYMLVRVESQSIGGDREISCLSCGGPLSGREDHFILKYFLACGSRQTREKMLHEEDHSEH